MAYTAVLEREIVNKNEAKQRETALAEAKHTANRHEAYLRSFGNGASAATQVLERPVDAPVRERRAAESRDTITLSPTQKKNALFKDFDYKDGMLVNRNTAEPVDVLVRTETPAAPKAEVAVAPAPIQVDEDDAIPTRRTMETLRQTAALQETSVQEEKTSFFAALSTKAKVVLIALVTTIVLAFIAICINTAIINSINADITNMRGKVTEQEATYATLSEEKESLVDPESEVVAQWAQEHGMTKES